MWDDPEIVDHRQCRYDVGLVVPDVKPCGEIGRFDFPAMQVAEVELRGGIDLETRASTGCSTHGSRTAALSRVISQTSKLGLVVLWAWMSHFEILAQIPIERG